MYYPQNYIWGKSWICIVLVLLLYKWVKFGDNILLLISLIFSTCITTFGINISTRLKRQKKILDIVKKMKTVSREYWSILKHIEVYNLWSGLKFSSIRNPHLQCPFTLQFYTSKSHIRFIFWTCFGKYKYWNVVKKHNLASLSLQI